MVRHAAQADNLPALEAIKLLERSIATLQAVVTGIREQRGKKEQVRRDLAGVIADVETVRMALK